MCQYQPKRLAIALIMVFSIGNTLFSGILLLVNGTLGDRSFFDSAAAGVHYIEENYGLPTSIIEMGFNPAEWEPTFLEVSSSGEYDVIIVGGWPFIDILNAHASSFPDIRYILFDSLLPRDEYPLSNVYAVRFKQNEGAFLIGYLAAMVTQNESIPHTLPDRKKIGFLGGVDTPEVQDFLIGYKQGAAYFDEEVEIIVAYAGSFKDPVKGKEIGLSLFQQNVDVVFAVAGETGIGLLEAAKEAGRWAIGVDSDVQLLYANKDPGIVAHTITSLLKRIDLAIIRAVSLCMKGEVVFGENEILGIADDMIGLAYNEYFLGFLDSYPSIAERLESVSRKLLESELEVDTAIP